MREPNPLAGSFFCGMKVYCTGVRVISIKDSMINKQRECLSPTPTAAFPGYLPATGGGVLHSSLAL